MRRIGVARGDERAFGRPEILTVWLRVEPVELRFERAHTFHELRGQRLAKRVILRHERVERAARFLDALPERAEFRWRGFALRHARADRPDISGRHENPRINSRGRRRREPVGSEARCVVAHIDRRRRRMESVGEDVLQRGVGAGLPRRFLVKRAGRAGRGGGGKEDGCHADGKDSTHGGHCLIARVQPSGSMEPREALRR